MWFIIAVVLFVLGLALGAGYLASIPEIKNCTNCQHSNKKYNQKPCAYCINHRQWIEPY